MEITINEIANLALCVEAKKKDANFILKQLIDSLANDDNDNIKNYLSKLYKIYLPTTKPTKTALKNPEIWVKQAVFKDDDKNRICLRYCYVEGGVMYATNTHTLHYCATDRPDGYYDANFNKIDVDMGYPDVKKIVETAKRSSKINQTIDDILKTRAILNADDKPSEKSIIHIKINDKLYDLKYFNQAAKPEAEIFQTHDGVLYIRNTDGACAVIAPCR